MDFRYKIGFPILILTKLKMREFYNSIIWIIQVNKGQYFQKVAVKHELL